MTDESTTDRSIADEPMENELSKSRTRLAAAMASSRARTGNFVAARADENLIDLGLKKDRGPLRVFVVEDDQELSAVIERVLRSISQDIKLDWATSAEAAIMKLKEALGASLDQSPYDLIVADIFLDGKRTGIDFWHTCQELFPEVPVLVTSALSLDKFFCGGGKTEH